MDEEENIKNEQSLKVEEKEQHIENDKSEENTATENLELKSEIKEQHLEDDKMKENKSAENTEQKSEVKEKKPDNKNNKDEEYRKIIKKRGKQKAIIISIIMLIIAFAVFSVIFSILNINNDKILSGVSINGIDMSGFTKEEARDQLEVLVNEKMEKDISVKYNEYESAINLKALEVNYNIGKAVDEAYEIGRNSNIVVNNYKILKVMLLKENIELSNTLNEESINTIVKDIESNLPGVVIESSYYREDDKLIVTKGTKGLIVDEENFIFSIKRIINDVYSKEDYLEIPVIEKEPNEIDLDKIHEEIFAEVKDAYYTTDPFTLYPEVEGVDFDVEAAKELLKEDKQEYEIQLTITKPKVTSSDIGTEAFPDLLGTFTTKYDASNTNRTTNLRLAASKINGTVILPGKEFSYNTVVGERTISAGYKEAKIYSNGEVVDGLGGGICQISSTLYNAVVFANLNVTTRRNHQFVTSYVQAGRDATVVYGSQDFKFVNNRKYPVKIQASVSSGVARISIYGIKEETEYEVSFSVSTISTIPYTVEYIEDASLAAGKESVKQKGSNGIITETYKIVKQNGVVVSRTLLSRDTYNAMKRIVLRGTTSTNTQTTETTPSVETPVTPSTPEIEEPEEEEKPIPEENTIQENAVL